MDTVNGGYVGRNLCEVVGDVLAVVAGAHAVRAWAGAGLGRCCFLVKSLCGGVICGADVTG
ncbi:hypothetical protein GCM10029964_089130 [Kibdelosporangium lantanae]